VIRTARRRTSSDGDIREAEPHDLAALVAGLPDLRMVGFNGGKAAAVGRRQLPPLPGVTLIDLPSSSAANTIGFAKKLDPWLALQASLAG
jgi:G:T/U-mismatch repair DNA glycosylase